MRNFYPGCLCYIKVLENDEDITVKVFAEDDEILSPIIDYIIRLYNRHEDISVADVLFGAWATGYGPEINAYTKHILDQNLRDHIMVRYCKENEKYVRYVLTIDGFRKRL